MKTNEDYLHLLEGVEKPKTWSRGYPKGLAGQMVYDKFLEEERLAYTDERILNDIQEEVRRMVAPYEGRVMDNHAGDMIRRGINNILEHYELTNGIYQGRYAVREAYDEGTYYITLNIQPRQPLEYVTVNIRL